MKPSVAGRVLEGAICTSPLAFLTPVRRGPTPAMGTWLGGHWVTRPLFLSPGCHGFPFFGCLNLSHCPWMKILRNLLKDKMGGHQRGWFLLLTIVDTWNSWNTGTELVCKGSVGGLGVSSQQKTLLKRLLPIKARFTGAPASVSLPRIGEYINTR